MAERNILLVLQSQKGSIYEGHFNMKLPVKNVFLILKTPFVYLFSFSACK
jgi:hypothetical protein